MAFAEDREQFWEQVNRLQASQALQASESLRKLLQYLAKHSLENPHEHVKEYQIATEVFGRSSGFDPQTDATVRVQVRRLRTKLADYYASDGRDDAVILDIPKGSYSIFFRQRNSLTDGQPQPVAPELDPPLPAPPAIPAFTRQRAIQLLAAIAIVFIAAISLLVFHRKALTVVAADHGVPVVFHEFWAPFVSGTQEPWVVFSNTVFVGRPETGMRYYAGAPKVRNEPISEHYTGVGEVLGVLDLDRMFSLLGHRFRAKRATMFTIDDAKNSNLIFVGSPAEDLALLRLPSTRDFVFQRVQSGARKGDLGITNLTPIPGEDKVYLPSPPSQPLKIDYAIIVFAPGLDPGHSTLILAGTTTIGTQAAVEYVCQADSLSELLRRLHFSAGEGLQPFEAVLRVTVAQDVPMATELVAVRRDH